jgi:hypothetical protein
VGQIKLSDVAQAFEQWRAEKVGKKPLPEALWAQATEAAREHGTTRTAQLLRLNHSALKRRLAADRGGKKAESALVPAQTFVELPSGASAGWPCPPREATLEVEDAAGFRLRLVLRGLEPREVAAAARELWSGRA